MKDQAVKAIIIKNKKVLILKQVVENTIFFGLPGGRINNGDLHNELIREIKEETDLNVKIEKYISDWSFTRKNGDITNCKIYLCTPLSDTLSDIHSEDYENIEEFLWLTSNEIKEKSFSMNSELKQIILKTMSA